MRPSRPDRAGYRNGSCRFVRRRRSRREPAQRHGRIGCSRDAVSVAPKRIAAEAIGQRRLQGAEAACVPVSGWTAAGDAPHGRASWLRGADRRCGRKSQPASAARASVGRLSACGCAVVADGAVARRAGGVSRCPVSVRYCPTSLARALTAGALNGGFWRRWLTTALRPPGLSSGVACVCVARLLRPLGQGVGIDCSAGIFGAPLPGVAVCGLDVGDLRGDGRCGGGYAEAAAIAAAGATVAALAVIAARRSRVVPRWCLRAGTGGLRPSIARRRRSSTAAALAVGTPFRPAGPLGR